jgi:hypothetical protein
VEPAEVETRLYNHLRAAEMLEITQQAAREAKEAAKRDAELIAAARKARRGASATPPTDAGSDVGSDADAKPQPDPQPTSTTQEPQDDAEVPAHWRPSRPIPTRGGSSIFDF